MELLRCILLAVNLLSIFLPFYNLCNAEGPASSLQLVNIFFRHGDRVPEKSYPKDPYNNVSIWYPDTWGALTKKGKQRTFALGQFLRKSYDGLLNKYYLPGEIIMKSSSNDRCIMSAQMVMAGLYPPKDVQEWNSSIEWQPIPVHMDSLITDMRLGECPKFVQLLGDIDNLLDVRHINEENKELYALLSQKTGNNITGLLQALSIYDTLSTEDENGLTLPSWTSNIYPEKLSKLLELRDKVFSTNGDIIQFGAGTILYQFIQNMVQKKEIQLYPNFKAMLYSTHDVYLLLILGVLGVEPVKPIGYAEALIFELHQIDSQYEIKLFYLKNAFTGETVTVDIPACGSPCTLEKFQQAFQHVSVSPEDRDKNCHVQNPDFSRCHNIWFKKHTCA